MRANAVGVRPGRILPTMAARVDEEIAELYRLPLAEFTSGRNALAKRAGARAAEVRALSKPAIGAWAVNQLYWHDRDTYDRLIGAAGDLRRAHAAVLGGGHGDVRAAGRSHEEAIEAALKATLAILRKADAPATDATRQAVASTLRALPSSDAPGQLTRTLQPGGFEMLSGLPVKAPSGPAIVPRPSNPPAPAHAPKADADAQRRTREAVAEAERAVRLAEHAAQREAFEAARAGRELEKARKSVAAAESAVKEAEAQLEEAQEKSASANEAKASADARAKDADDAVEEARERLRDLKKAK